MQIHDSIEVVRRPVNKLGETCPAVKCTILTIIHHFALLLPLLATLPTYTVISHNLYTQASHRLTNLKAASWLPISDKLSQLGK